MPTPPTPVTVTFAVAVPPEQIELAPQAADAGVTVRLLKIGAGLTVTVAVALVPAESWAVIRTAVSARTLAGSSTMGPLVTDAPRGRIAVLLDTTKYGGTPPTTVKVAGVFEKTVAAEGRMERGPGVVGGGLNGLFGAPLPPPQPPRTASVANASRAEMSRS